MERLTLEEAICRVRGVAKKQRWNSKYTKVSLMNEELNKQHKADCVKDAEEHEQLAEWLEKLKSYEDLEEQGLLVRLPVPLGSKVYWISTRDKQNPIIFEKFFVLGMLYFWDSTVFATREEAEKKLEEIQNDKT